MATTTGRQGGRPLIQSTRGAIVAGHYLAGEAGMAEFRAGGNAVDAAAAAGFALTVVMPHQNGLAGEAPMLVQAAGDDAPVAVNGNGTAPAAATLEAYTGLGLDLIPGDGLLPAVVPATPAAWIALLRRFGTRRLADVLAPAIELAEGGFPMYDELHGVIAASADRFRRDWPSSAETFLTGPKGAPPPVGTIFRQGALAATLKALARADRLHRRRDDGLRAALDAFYRGSIARRIDRHCRQAVPDGTGTAHTGLLREEDLAAYEARIEPPVSVTYRGWRVHKCSTWCQGPAMLQALKLLEGYDLKSMGHNSADYVHTVVEAMKLAFADREFHYGDPQFVRVPFGRLLSAAYARQRRELIDAASASMELRPGGAQPLTARDVRAVNARFGAPSGPAHGDTTAVHAVDAAGTIVAVITSGGWLQSSPVIEGVGCPLGTRGQMFSLAAGHPNAPAPGKRPRTSLTPSLAGRTGRRAQWSFGSPGGDCQDQWALQFFLNVTAFGLSAQEAVEAPTFWSGHWPSSFYPRAAAPGVLHLESRIAPAVRAELRRRGHRVRVEAPFAGGNAMAVSIDAGGVLRAAASPRHEPAYAMGW
ncbi:MAG: gamma-glutamyltransferase family protein [Planctomycetes bacterium]|nr:gamma-glutamyltransferase family protein [Planctomycetota bacterium]